MRLKVLSDNRKLHDVLEKEHGLCIYLETGKYKCLLDVGASDKFIHNAEQMEIEIEDIDYVFISHGHSDHIGGLEPFLKRNTKAKIVLSKNALTQQFFSVRNGLRDLSSKVDIHGQESRFVFVDSKTVFEDDIQVFPCQSCFYPIPKANKTLMKENNGELVADDFNHELIVCFGINDDVVVYSGCAHCGILNILDSVKQVLNRPVSVLIGGFHLLDGYEGQYETEDEINKIVEQLDVDFPKTRFYTGHCTGEGVYLLLKKKLDGRLSWFYTGFVVSIKQ